MEAQPREIRRYVTPQGKIPFARWLESLRDLKAVVKIETRLDRLRQGNFGNCRSLGDGVSELKIDYGPGYRIYFAQAGAIVILLLCGGNKSTQIRDIRKAKEYWYDYQQHRNSEER